MKAQEIIKKRSIDKIKDLDRQKASLNLRKKQEQLRKKQAEVTKLQKDQVKTAHREWLY